MHFYHFINNIFRFLGPLTYPLNLNLPILQWICIFIILLISNLDLRPFKPTPKPKSTHFTANI